jgi:DNA-binding response OmpR family regulator
MEMHEIRRVTYASNGANRGLTGGLSPDELLTLIESIARRLRQREERKPQPLHGIWKEKLPEDADIGGALKEVRQPWQKDFEEFKK